MRRGLGPLGATVGGVSRGLTYYLRADGTLDAQVTNTFTRATAAYSPETGALVASGNPRYVTGKNGQAIYIEEGTTNVFINSATPATQSISLTTANSGKWTCSVVGAGTVTSSAGTATASGYGAATMGTPNTVIVTGNGTVTYTVAGADATTRVQVENKAYATSYQDSANATRNVESLSFNPTGIITPSQGTVSVWVNASNVWLDTTNTAQAFSHADASSNDNIAIFKTANQIRFRSSNHAGTSSSISINTTLTPGWHHLAVTWNASELAGWIDGVKQTNAVSTPNIPSVLATAYIGQSFSVTQQVNTSLDNLRIYNRVLSAIEILALFNRSI